MFPRMIALVQSMEELLPPPILGINVQVYSFLGSSGDGGDYDYGDYGGSGTGNGQSNPFCADTGNGMGDGTYQGNQRGDGRSVGIP